MRLTFGELSTSLGQLLGEDAAAAIAEELEPSGENHAFPPLAAASEGPVIDDQSITCVAGSCRRAALTARK